MVHVLPPTRSSRRPGHRRAGTLEPSPLLSKPQPLPEALDKPLLWVTVVLSVLGLVAVYSASAAEAMAAYGNSLYFVLRQGLFFLVGGGLLWGVSRLPFYTWNRWARPIALVVIALLAWTLHSGVEAYGAERWIRIFGLQFQPSELGKISVVLLLAQGLGQPEGRRRTFGFLLNLALIGLTLMLIYKQPSLSMTLILSGVSGAMMFIAGTPWWLLLGVGGAGGAYVVHKLLHTEYQLRRIQGWLHPEHDPQDTGYNLIQSLLAIGSGGVFGTGLGMSHQKLYYLPFQYTDFIFAVWAEEWGFLGCLVLIGLFVCLLYRGVVIGRACRSPFGQLLAMGFTLVLAAQVVINLSVATGLFPVTGVTLPLISYGGTSVLVTLLMIGILLNISRYRVSLAAVLPSATTAP